MSEDSLPQVVNAALNTQLAAVDERMAEIAKARYVLQKNDDTLRKENDELRLARTGLATALRIPRTPTKRAEPQKTTEPKPTKAKTGEARVTDAAKT